MDKDRSRGIRRAHHRRVIQNRRVWAEYADRTSPCWRYEWCKKAIAIHGYGWRWDVQTVEQKRLELRYCLRDEGKTMLKYWYRPSNECACWSGCYTDRRNCDTCRRRARMKAGELGMDVDYADWHDTSNHFKGANQ